MNIGIIGFGTVGRAIHAGLSQIGNKLSYHDVNSDTTIDQVLDTQIVYVCVPTDSLPNGDCDTSCVESVVDQLASHQYQGIIAIKSTVIPGTTDKLISRYPNCKICFVPEFLRQKSAESDFIDFHDVLVIGTTNGHMADIIQRSHGHIPKSVIVISPIEAEVVKYFNNVYNAMNIVFANAMHEMCKKLGANYQSVLSAVGKRSNVNRKYLQCSDFYKGFGGHCLPKDTVAWANLAKQLEVDVGIFADIVNDNSRYMNENNSNRQ